MDFPGGSVVKNLPANTGNTGLIPGLGRSPGEGIGNLLQYSCLGNSMDRGAWWAIIHGVAKSQTRLSDFTFTFTFPVFLPGKFHGQRSLVGYSPWGRKELDMTERLNNEANSFVNVQVPTYHPALTVLTFYQSCSSISSWHFLVLGVGAGGWGRVG